MSQASSPYQDFEDSLGMMAESLERNFHPSRDRLDLRIFQVHWVHCLETDSPAAKDLKDAAWNQQT